MGWQRDPPLPSCRAEAGAEGAESDWAKTPIGSIAKGAVHDVKDYGTVCDLEANSDVVGLAATHQVGSQQCLAAELSQRGSAVRFVFARLSHMLGNL